MTPITELDAPYSMDDAEATAWEEVRAAIEAAQLFWISTVRADGRPHVTPLVAVWLDDALHFSTGPLEQKAVNLRHNDRVALTTGCNDWQGGLDIVVEGPAVRVTDDAALHRLADAWRTKWDGFWQYEVRDGEHWQEGHNAHVFRVAPTKVLSFNKTTGAATRHRFPLP
jgi:nitroimidazol reductase NimA-like FMN-containing flavoprotein (pyridoxamine 5'-phosphate oxidase superfamily)